MRSQYKLNLEIPEGVECEFSDGTLKCKKGELSSEKKLPLQRSRLKISGNSIEISCEKANKKDKAIAKTCSAHIQNTFKGLGEKFTYELEICHVHFPITAKVEGNKVVINNFLGEKVNRIAKITDEAKVEIKGQKVSVTSHDIEKAGQTAANIEKAARAPKKDRRVFQDGIFITSKPGGEI